MSQLLTLHQKFDSFEELDATITKYQSLTFSVLIIKDCRRIETARKRAFNKTLKETLKYNNIMYTCYRGGEYKKRGHAIRKTTTSKTGCPFMLNFKATKDGQQLELKDWVTEHNHDLLTKEAFLQHRRTRRLDPDNRKEAEDLLKLNTDRKVVRKHFVAKTGKQLNMRDIHNIATHLKNKKKQMGVASEYIITGQSESDQDRLEASDPPVMMQHPESGMPGLSSSVQPCMKRKRLEEHQNNNDMENVHPAINVIPRSFLHIACSHCVFDANEDRAESTLYHPVKEDLMVNLRNIEQISFSFGSFFVANEKGEYSCTKQGYCIKLFRYSENAHSLYISRSFLVTDIQVYQQLRQSIEIM